jgi:hypothetical protein
VTKALYVDPSIDDLHGGFDNFEDLPVLQLSKLIKGQALQLSEMATERGIYYVHPDTSWGTVP